MKNIVKYILVVVLGVGLSFIYSYIVKGGIDVETIAVFCLLYAYIVFFLKFLAKLFK